jgi:outer membrane protein assembly factor BamB
MRFNKNKNKSLLTAFIVLSFALTLIALPTINAHSPPWSIQPYAYIAVSYDPIGVGQQDLVVFWLNTYPPTNMGLYGDAWQNMTVTVTAPDGTEQTLGPFTSDPVGGGYTLFTPTQVGIYQFQMNFPGQTLTGQPLPPQGIQGLYNAEYVNDTYLPCTSNIATLTITQEQRQPFEETPLPTGYWSNPVNIINRNWYTIDGDWLGGSAVLQRTNPYSQAVLSPHIVWTRQYWAGGQMGGQFGAVGYYNGESYEGYWGGITGGGPMIVNGMLYYNVQTPPRYGWYAIDLRTGQEQWFHNSTQDSYKPSVFTGGVPGAFGFESSGAYNSLMFAQEYYYQSPNQFGGFPYLWSSDTSANGSTVWQMYDAFTGNYICSIDNVPAAGSMFGPGGFMYTQPDGSITIYYLQLDEAHHNLAVWNNTYAIWNTGLQYVTANAFWFWRPFLNWTFDGQRGWSSNVTLSNDVPISGPSTGQTSDQAILGATQPATITAVLSKDPSQPPDKLLCTAGNTQFALSLESSNYGQLLWKVTRDWDQLSANATMPQVNGEYGMVMSGIEMGPASDVDGVYTMYDPILRQYWAFSLDNGQQLWETPAQDVWSYYSLSSPGIIYNGLLIYIGQSMGASSTMYAYDVKNGNIVWAYHAPAVGMETPYGGSPLALGCVADGVIYVYSDEHSPNQPLWRGSDLRAINASTGTELWKIAHWGQGSIIADGYIVDLNQYSGQIECYGKGLSATTVTCAPAIGSSYDVVITGTVTDQSPGQTCLGIPAAGTPAISDDSTGSWMEYLYMQQPMPTNATGVPVHLTAIDPNGNFQDIGVTTSDTMGNYALSWSPPVPGLYTVTAAFEGSNSYFSSKAGTSFVVSEAAVSVMITEPPSPSQASQPTSGIPTTTYIALATAVIIIVAVTTVIAIKRRK